MSICGVPRAQFAAASRGRSAAATGALSSGRRNLQSQDNHIDSRYYVKLPDGAGMIPSVSFQFQPEPLPEVRWAAPKAGLNLIEKLDSQYGFYFVRFNFKRPCENSRVHYRMALFSKLLGLFI